MIRRKIRGKKKIRSERMTGGRSRHYIHETGKIRTRGRARDIAGFIVLVRVVTRNIAR